MAAAAAPDKNHKVSVQNLQTIINIDDNDLNFSWVTTPDLTMIFFLTRYCIWMGVY